MSITYIAACLDCQEYLDLHNHFRMCGEDESYDEFEREFDDDPSTFINYKFVYLSCRMQFFLSKHKGHRVGVFHEHDSEYFDITEKGKEVYPIPERRRKTLPW